MPVSALLRLLLPGLLPLLVYVVASEVWGDTVGLAVGVGLGLAEFGLLALRQRRLDWFVLGDTALLVLLGGVSLALDDHVFFRLKPVLTEALLVVLLAASAWGRPHLLLGMVFRGEAGTRLRDALTARPAAAAAVQGRLRLVTVVFAAHGCLALASALWMDKEAWAFITGVLPLVLAGLLFVAGLVFRR